nr:putative reverse transcriptase domain-containing protein [Tanacetum cinerariifolium]
SLELIHETTEKIVQIKQRIQAARDRQKIYVKLSKVYNTFCVSNLKKCLSDEPLAIPLDEIHNDEKLHFVEEPIEIMNRRVKQLKKATFTSSKFNGTPGEILSSRGNMKTSSERSILNSSPQPHPQRMLHLESYGQGSVNGRRLYNLLFQFIFQTKLFPLFIFRVLRVRF